MTANVQYSVIIPMYNEQAIIQETYRRLKEVMEMTEESYELLFIISRIKP